MRTANGTRRRLLYCAIIAVSIAALGATLRALPDSVYGNPQAPAASADDAGRVVVDTGPPSMPADGSFTIRSTVRVDEPTPYLEIRLQIRRPSGALIFQRTDVSSDVETGTVSAEFTRELEDLSLAPDAYPYEIRVRTEIGEPREQVVEGYLLIHDPDPDVMPLSLIVRVAEVPGFDPAGHFVVDPGASTSSIDQVALLAGAVVDDPALNLTLAVPGMTVDAWSRVASGYTLSGPDGLREVAQDEETPLRYAAALELLRDALATGRLELLDIPYADPDVGALAQAGSLLDLGIHYVHSRGSYQAALDTSPSAGTAVFGDALPPGALEVLKERDIAWVLFDPESLTAGETTPTAGAWDLEGTRVSALVFDPVLSGAIRSAEPSSTLLRLFRRSISEEATSPVAATIEIGSGKPQAAEEVLALASLVSRVPWAQTSTGSEAAGSPPLGTATPPATVSPASAAPHGYAAEVAEARRYAIALEAALGVEDPDVELVTESSLLAESARWAGPDDSWSMADRGRAFASAALRHASSFLDQVSLTIQDVTLSGASGDLPLSVANDSAKPLAVKLVLKSSDVHLPQGTTQSLALRPQENFHTVRVDLGSSLSGRIGVELWAGDVLLDSSTSTVRASYLDRLAIVGGVALLLVGLLAYIRRHIRSADAGKMP